MKGNRRDGNAMKWFMLIAQFVVLYGAAIGVWGPALGKSVLWFAIIGGVIGLLRKRMGRPSRNSG